MMKKLFVLITVLFSVPAFAQKGLAQKLEKIATAYYDAYNNRDIPGQLAIMTDDFEYMGNSGKLRKGKEEYKKYTEGLFQEINEKVVDLKFITDVPKGIVAVQSNAVGTYDKASEGMPKATGQKYTLPVVEVFEIKDGKIKKLTTYYNEDLFTKQISEPKK